MDDEPQVEQLENRIDKLESTIQKMMPSRRDALKMGGAALAGGSLMSGTASAGTNQVGTIGSQASPVDLESEDINNSDTVTTDTMDSTTVNNSGTMTTQDIVVNGTATGPFGGGGVVLEPGDSITLEKLNLAAGDRTFKQVYSGPARDVLMGTFGGQTSLDFLYEFSNNQTFTKNSGFGATTFNFDFSIHEDGSNNSQEVAPLPPAKDVIRIEIAGDGADIGGSVLLKG